MLSHQLGKKNQPQTAGDAAEMPTTFPGLGCSLFLPPMPCLLWPRAPALPGRKGQQPPAEGRTGAVVSPPLPGDPSPRSPHRPRPPRAQAAAGWLTPAGPRADKRPIFSPPK